MDNKASQIDDLILDDTGLTDVVKSKEVGRERETYEPETFPDSGESTRKTEEEKPRELKVILRPNPQNSEVCVTTHEGKSYSFDDIQDSGLFLLIAVMISGSDKIPINERVKTTYGSQKSLPLFLSSLLINKFNKPSRRSKYTEYKVTIRTSKRNKIVRKNESVERKLIKSEYLEKSIKEGSMGEKKVREGKRKAVYWISKLPKKSYNHKLNIKEEVEEKFVLLESESGSGKYYVSDEIDEIKFSPEWIESDRGEGVDEEWAKEIAEKLTS
jgi:hypothetical protein